MNCLYNQFVDEIKKNLHTVTYELDKKFKDFCLVLFLGMTSYDKKLDQIIGEYDDEKIKQLEDCVKEAFTIFQMEEEEVKELIQKIYERKEETFSQSDEKEPDPVECKPEKKKCNIQLVGKNKDFPNANFNFSKESPVEYSLKNKKFWTNKMIKIKGVKEELKFNKMTNLILCESSENEPYLYGMIFNEGECINFMKADELPTEIIEWCEKSKIFLKSN